MMTPNTPIPVEAPATSPRGDLPLSTPRKTAKKREAQTAANRSAPSLPELRAALSEHPTILDAVMTRFRAAGGSTSRWTRPDHEILVDALIKTEDAMPDRDDPLLAPRPKGAPKRQGNASKARVTLRAIRQRIELQVWP